jgi:signal transduction histidine kinase/DNA-binding response OmpR family regulator
MVTILVVDDRAADRLFLATLLGYGGHRILEAGDGAAALAVVRDHSPDLVVTDLLLPGIDGFELMRQLRADPASVSTPVIVYSATYCDSEARSLAKTCGVSYFLTKPTEPEVILRTVANALRGAVPSTGSPEAFDRDHARLLNDKLFQRDNALEAARRLAALVQMGQSLTLERDSACILDQFCRAARETLDAAVAAVGLIDPKTSALRLYVAVGTESTIRAPRPPNPLAGALGPVVTEGRACRLRNLLSGPGEGAFLPAGQTARSFLAVPVSTPWQILGWLFMLDKGSADEFSADDEQLAVALAGQAGIACENAARYEEVHRQSELLREADRYKNEFLAMLAHELRNPLAPIRNALHIMGLPDVTAETIDPLRLMMERQIGQIVRLVDDLLDTARISQGKLLLKTERVELMDVVGNALDCVRPLMAEMGHELTISIGPSSIPLNGDPVRLEQVILNLLNNAAKYSDQGGHIRLAVERQGKDAVVSITDSGIGIAPEKLPMVFETFTQVGESVDRSQGGLGLGLSLVKRLVAMHGGSVEAKSEGLGKGSEFVVRLPMLISPIAVRARFTEEDTCLSRRRILVVDDNRDSVESLAMLLQAMDHCVQIAYDGIEAVELAESFSPDVVLLDIGMPRINGHEACRRIRKQPWGKNMTLVALSGWGQDDDRRKSLDAGFDAHLVKPADLGALVKLLAERQPASA